MTISKSTAWKIAAGLVSIFLLWQGYNFTKGMWIDWALNQAKAKHQAEIAVLQVKIDASKAAYSKLAEASGKYRAEQIAAAEAEKRRHENAVAILKSESAEKLRERNATIAEVLKAKELDELRIIEDQETIDAKDAQFADAMKRWAQSDIDKDAAHAEVVAGLEAKYQACAKWTTVLEKRLKKSFWSKFGEYAKYGAAFGAGYMAGRAMK
jgi:hypothetical protein